MRIEIPNAYNISTAPPKVYATMGDKDELRKLQREYGRHPNIVYRWEDVYRPMWNKARRKQEMARHG